MTESVPAPATPSQDAKSLADHLRAIEFDARMIGMIAALAVIWLGFNWLSGGAFLTPRNLWNLSVQTASVAVMACGMVLVIVTRNIDLSVGSMLGFVGMVTGLVQAQLLPGLLGFEHPATWLLSILAAIVLGGLIGLFQGALIAYLAIPSFIVTLGGLLVWRGGAWWVTQGQTIAPMDSRFRPLGGGIEGAGLRPEGLSAGSVLRRIAGGRAGVRRDVRVSGGRRHPEGLPADRAGRRAGRVARGAAQDSHLLRRL